jgi:hypothetical protein
MELLQPVQQMHVIAIPSDLTYVDELQLFSGAAYADGKEQDITLQPRNVRPGILEANSWVGHIVL